MPDEVRPVEVLEALWTALRDNYPAFEFVVGAEEQPWLEEFRGRLEGVSALTEAYPILAELVDRFHDYHTGLWWPETQDLSSPAVRLGYIEDVVAVRKSEEEALRPGDVLLSIDGEESGVVFQRWLGKARGATEFARRQWACNHLLEGPKGSHVKIEIQKENAERTIILSRNGWPSGEVVAVEARDLAPDAGYIRIPIWVSPQGQDLLALFDKALAAFQERPYLVLDVRGNGGGSDALADGVTGRFLRRPVVSSISFHRVAGTNTYEKTVEIARPRGPWRYEGRIAVLIDEDCFSACGHFISGMTASGQALIVGRAAPGACGWSKGIELPGGSTLYCAMTIPFHGKQFLPLHSDAPHLQVLPTLAGLQAGRDEMLETALDYLRSGLPFPEHDSR